MRQRYQVLSEQKEKRRAEYPVLHSELHGGDALRLGPGVLSSLLPVHLHRLHPFPQTCVSTPVRQRPSAPERAMQDKSRQLLRNADNNKLYVNLGPDSRTEMRHHQLTRAPWREQRVVHRRGNNRVHP